MAFNSSGGGGIYVNLTAMENGLILKIFFVFLASFIRSSLTTIPLDTYVLCSHGWVLVGLGDQREKERIPLVVIMLVSIQMIFTKEQF